MAKSFAELAEKLPEHEREHVRELAENVLFMRGKLEETRKGLANSQVVIAYDNGGGQTGIRRNPAFDGYQALLKSYTAALNELRGLLEGEAKSERTAKVVSVAANSRWRKASNG
jgi:hypothetical protein